MFENLLSGLKNGRSKKDTSTGMKTGDFNESGEVYIKFPGIVSNLSGFYGCEKLEKLCEQSGSYKGMVKSFMTKDVIQAVTALYEKSKKKMPDVVRSFLGI